MKKMLKKLDEKLKPLNKPVRNVLAAALALHVATQALYTGKGIGERISPTPLQEQLKRGYDLTLRGDPSKRVDNLSPEIANYINLNFGDLINRENHIGHLGTSSITLRSPNYLGKNVLDQLGKIVTTGNSGCYIPQVKKIALDQAFLDDTLTHELKHAKHFDILKSHPELNDHWEQISKNEDGKSLYAPAIVGVANKLRLLNLLVPKDLNQPTRDELLKQGFVSEYARTNVYEDIAELCSVAEEVSFSSSCSTYSSLENALLSDDPAYDKIQRKVTLAEKYGLISPGLKEFGQVRKEINPYYAAKEDHHKIAHRASKFIAKYPSSVHASHAAQLAADAHLSLATIYNGDPNEYFKACAQIIKLPYVEPAIIDLDLKMLADLYSIAGNRDSMRVLNGTRVDYKTRRAEGDVLVGISEVRERLKAGGVDLDNLPTIKPGSITIFNTHRWSESSGW